MADVTESDGKQIMVAVYVPRCQRLLNHYLSLSPLSPAIGPLKARSGGGAEKLFRISEMMGLKKSFRISDNFICPVAQLWWLCGGVAVAERVNWLISSISFHKTEGI